MEESGRHALEMRSSDRKTVDNILSQSPLKNSEAIRADGNIQ
jgi:hypothetical protein